MKKIHEFRVLHDGWEMDNAARVVEDVDGRRKLETTNHGRKCEMSKEKLFRENIRDGNQFDSAERGR